MVLRVKPTPTRFPTNSLYTPMDKTPLHSIPSVCHPQLRRKFSQGWSCATARGFLLDGATLSNTGLFWANSMNYACEKSGEKEIFWATGGWFDSQALWDKIVRSQDKFVPNTNRAPIYKQNLFSLINWGNGLKILLKHVWKQTGRAGYH